MHSVKEKIKQLYSSGAIHIIGGTFATKFVAFFGSIFVARILSKDDYGIMGYAETIYSYAFIFAGLGLSYAVLRFLVLAETAEKKKQYFQYILQHGIIRNIIIAGILVVGVNLFPIPANYTRTKALIPILALLLPFQDILNDDLYLLRAFFKNKRFAYLSLVSSVLLILGRIFGALYGGIDGVLWSRVIISAFFSVTFLYLIWKRYFAEIKVTALPKKEAGIVNSYSIQYMITNGLWAVFMLNDAFMIGQLINDPGVLADYKIACVLPGNISIFATAIGIYTGPRFTKNENDKVWIRTEFRKVYMITAGVVGGAAILLALFSNQLILLMYGKQYLNVVPLMRVLLIGAFINSGLRYTTANLLAAMGEIKYNMFVSGIGIVAQLIIDYILIPKMGVMAVAVSNIIVFALMAISIMAIFIKKYYK